MHLGRSNQQLLFGHMSQKAYEEVPPGITPIRDWQSLDQETVAQETRELGERRNDS